MSHHCVAVVSTFLQPTENISQLSKNAAAKPYYKLSLDAQDLTPPDNKIFYHDMIHIYFQFTTPCNFIHYIQGKNVQKKWHSVSRTGKFQILAELFLKLEIWMLMMKYSTIIKLCICALKLKLKVDRSYTVAIPVSDLLY